MNVSEEHEVPNNDPSMEQKILAKLKEEEDRLEKKLKALQQAAADKVKVMEALHEYNDIKDATQVVLGQLANFYDVTVLKMHEKYNLLDDD